MELSPKTTRFVIEALDHFVKLHLDRACQDHLSEDAIADVENDRLFLQAIKRDFEKHLDTLTRRRENSGDSALIGTTSSSATTD